MGFHAVNFVWLNHTNIGGARKLLLVALAHKVDDDSGECWPSINTLSEMVACKDRSVRKQMADLEEIGAITRHHREGRSNKYRLTGYLEWHKQVKSISKPVLPDIPAESDTPVHMDSPPAQTDSPPVSVDIPTPVRVDSQSISSINQKASTNESTTKSTSPPSAPAITGARTHEGEGATLESIKDQLLASFGQNFEDLSKAKRAELDSTARFLHERGAIPTDVLALYRWVMDREVQPKDPDVKPWSKPHTFSFRHLEERYAVWKAKRVDLPQYYAKPEPETFPEPDAPPDVPPPVLVPSPKDSPPEPDEIAPPEPEVEPDRWRQAITYLLATVQIGERHLVNNLRLVAYDGDKAFTIEAPTELARRECQGAIGPVILNAIAMAFKQPYSLLRLTYTVKAMPIPVALEVAAAETAQEAAA